jgi:hypothetical protein
VLYLEGSTDLAILQGLAGVLDHPAKDALARPFVHYVANQPAQARHHFYGLREAKADLKGIAVYDRLGVALNNDPKLVQISWQRREIENYLCQRETLLAWAQAMGSRQHGELFGPTWRQTMDDAITEIAQALAALGKGDPWGADIKASDDFLDPLFRKFFEKLALPNLMAKTDYHTLVPCVPRKRIDPEVRQTLDRIAEVASTATRAEGPGT